MIANTATVLTLPAPTARFLVLDIETGDAPEEAITAAVNAWKAPSNWKPETVEKNRIEAAAKIREKAALLDASPILCVGIRSDRDCLLFSGMGELSTVDIAGWQIKAHPNECEMLKDVRTWLDAHTDEMTTLAGHNVRNFDLPKLRGAYVRHRLPLPACLRPREGQGQPVTDTMTLFRTFSMEHRDDFAVSLDVVCSTFGIKRIKQVITSADVPRLHLEGRIEDIINHCCIDVDDTTEIYQLMMA